MTFSNFKYCSLIIEAMCICWPEDKYEEDVARNAGGAHQGDQHALQAERGGRGDRVRRAAATAVAAHTCSVNPAGLQHRDWSNRTLFDSTRYCW